MLHPLFGYIFEARTVNTILFVFDVPYVLTLQDTKMCVSVI